MLANSNFYVNPFLRDLLLKICMVHIMQCYNIEVCIVILLLIKVIKYTYFVHGAK